MVESIIAYAGNGEQHEDLALHLLDEQFNQDVFIYGSNKQLLKQKTLII